MAVQEGGDFLLQAQIRRKPFTRKKLSKSCPNYPCFAVALIFCCQNKDPSCSKIFIWIIWRFTWLKIASEVYSKSLFVYLHFYFHLSVGFFHSIRNTQHCKMKMNFQPIYHILLFCFNIYKPPMQNTVMFRTCARRYVKAMGKHFLWPAVIKWGSTGS